MTPSSDCLSTLCVIWLMALVACAARADVSVPSIFSEGMVLQRDVAVPVWGWAGDGEKVTVSVYDGGAVLAKAETVAADGRWRVDLPPLAAGGRYALLVEGRNRILFSNVLVGEVWLICGQSNMLMPVESSASREEAVANRHKYPNLRVALVGRRDPHVVVEPQEDTEGYWGPVKWENSTYTVPRSSKTDVPGCSSAVSYFFARELYDHLGGDVPVGMIEIGAIQRVESWVDDETIAATPELVQLRGKPYPHATSRCFNANIAPLAPFAARGAIYYQGEMNAGNGEAYGHGLAALIRSWRKAWSASELPFLVVQLPGFIEHRQERDEQLDMDDEALARFHDQSEDHGFCGVREAQLKVAQSVPNTGLAVTIDLGDPYDIHPRRKKPVAERLFLQARRLVYGEAGLVAGGPLPTGVRRDGNAAVVDFEDAGGGLVFEGGEPDGFEVRAEDDEFVDAEVRIDGTSVVLTHPEGRAVTSVRYAWAGLPRVSLYNKEGLPATPFRFDVGE